MVSGTHDILLHVTPRCKPHQSHVDSAHPGALLATSGRAVSVRMVCFFLKRSGTLLSLHYAWPDILPIADIDRIFLPFQT